MKRAQRWQKEPIRSTGVAAFWKQFGYRIAHIEIENEGILVKVTSAREYEEKTADICREADTRSCESKSCSESFFFWMGVVTLLTQIDRLGSVREACAKTGMSYSKGWKLIHTAEEETGWKIVERMSGGKNGGEAYITERGHMLLEKYELYRERVEAAAQDIYKDVFQDGELF